MADLRSKFIEDYAGGLLNVSRQELASTGEVLSQDGLLSDATLFVEDGSGTKSGLKLGASTCEVVDPTTEEGAVNVRFADRTYASIRDLKIFSTAVASAQAALADASSSSITNLENAFQLLENSQDTISNLFNSRNEVVDQELKKLNEIDSLSSLVANLQSTTQGLALEVKAIETSVQKAILSNNTLKAITSVPFDSYGSVFEVQILSGPDTRRDAQTNTAVTGLTSASGGSGLNVTVTVDAEGAVTDVSIAAGGTNFLPGDEITILDSSLTNTSPAANDIKIKVLSVNANTSTNKLADQVALLYDKVNEIITAFDS
tara:strand:- start:5251 stop:6201 length:951 start_codon:yes stop_codon:yes gene_type:complete